MSNFFLHPDLNSVNPKIHFFAPWHPPLIRENYAEWLRDADQKLPAATEICLGWSTHQIVDDYGLFKDRNVHYLYLSELKPETITLNRPILAPQSGPLMILPVLLAMGYRRINLLGCDHTVLRNFGSTISHFYTPEQDIRNNASDKNAWTGLRFELESTLRMLDHYEYYSRVASQKGIQIVNLSQDSWLDIFPRQRLVDNLG